jgi:hypothetical protein
MIGDRPVQGRAMVGDFVTYEDAANQGGRIWRVTALPETTSMGFSTEYALEDLGGSGVVNNSDLRQLGWRFVARANPAFEKAENPNWCEGDRHFKMEGVKDQPYRIVRELTEGEAADLGCPGANAVLVHRLGHIVGTLTEVTGRLVRVTGWSGRGKLVEFEPWQEPERKFRGHVLVSD